MALPDGYTITRGSDVERDGTFLELSHAGDVVAEAFYSNETKRISVTCIQSPLPIEAIAFLTTEAWRRLPPEAPVDPRVEPEYLLDVQTDSSGSQVFIHADAEGLATLAKSVERLRTNAESGECDHDHLFAEDWGGYDLSASVLSEGTRHVAHVKIYGWSNDWLEKNPRGNKRVKRNGSPAPVLESEDDEKLDSNR